MRSLLSVADLSADGIAHLLDRAEVLKRDWGGQPLKDKALGLLFDKPSLRTRLSFEVGMRRLGGHSIYLSQGEVGVNLRESATHVARVLSRYLDGLVVRTSSQELVAELARWASMPVINGLTSEEHPCQALADLLTMREKKGRLAGLAVGYVGDGNNVAHSLMLACALMGIDLRLATPPGYGPWPAILKQARRLATRSRLELGEEPAWAVAGADVVYTDVWTSMGQEAEAMERRRAFVSYQVTPHLLAQAKDDVILMHPLPAHSGEEVAPGLLDGPPSVVFDQAENRLHLQMALLVELLG